MTLAKRNGKKVAREGEKDMNVKRKRGSMGLAAQLIRRRNKKK